MNLIKTLIYVALMVTCLSACQSDPVGTTLNDTLLANEDTLSLETAKRYVKNYAKRAGTIDSSYIDDSGKMRVKKLENTRAVWFSISKLKALVERIESQGGDGIRFYYAAYDSTYSDSFKGHKPPMPYWNRNTLVMVSTKDSLSYHRDYYAVKDGKEQEVGFSIAPPENRGEQCPPPTDCYTIGATLIAPTEK